MSIANKVAASLMISVIDVSSETVHLPATSKPPDSTAVPLEYLAASEPTYTLIDEKVHVIITNSAASEYFAEAQIRPREGDAEQSGADITEVSDWGLENPGTDTMSSLV